MSQLTRELFLYRITDKLAADNDRTLPIIAGSGMALAGGGSLVPLAVSYRRLKQLESPLSELTGQLTKAEAQRVQAEQVRAAAEKHLKEDHQWLEGASTGFNKTAPLNPSNPIDRMVDNLTKRTSEPLEKLKASTEASIKSGEKKIATIDRYMPKHMEKIQMLKDKLAPLEAAKGKNLYNRLLKLSGKHRTLAQLGMAGLPAALLVGGLGLAGHNIYKQHQENQPWYKKFLN